MTPREFFGELRVRFPRMRLSEEQGDAYCADLAAYRLSMDLVRDVAATCEKVFPSIADIAKHAGRKEAQDRPWMAPHTWQPTACPHCGGEGQVAIFGSLYMAASGDDRDRLEIDIVAGQSSDDARDYRAENGHRTSEFLARCVCGAGDAVTLSKGWPKWDGKQTFYRRVPV